MNERQLEILSGTLIRIADSLERLVEVKQKPRQKRTSAPLEYDPRFNKAWAEYPKRNGSNPKAAAYKAWRARLKQATHIDDEVDAMFDGTKRYAAWCDATGKTGTETVMQAQRFFGPSCEYDEPWTIAEQPQLIRVPYDVNELVKFARDYGMAANPGESTWEFRQRVEDYLAQSTL